MDILVMRGLERLVVVLIGGMAIYLGYRLFLKVKTDADGEAKITLPRDVTVMVSRVGPGVFFALFGSLVVTASLYFSISYDGGDQISYRGMGQGSSTPTVASGTARVVPADDEEALSLNRVRLSQEVEFLNRLPAMLDHLNEVQLMTVDRHVREIKLGLMAALWSDDWGDPAAFRNWAEGGSEAIESDAFERARLFFDAGAGPPS
ncbi:MAG: hypothetical protein AAF637_02055 [Pseudomonadota bacterium]